MSKLTVYVDIFTFTKYIIHGNVHFLCTDLCKLNRQKNTVKKKTTHFLKNCSTSLFTFFEKIFAICIFFIAWYLDVRFCDLLHLFVSSTFHRVGISFFAVRKCVDLVVIFNKRRGETFAVSLQNCKSCVCIKNI